MTPAAERILEHLKQHKKKASVRDINLRLPHLTIPVITKSCKELVAAKEVRQTRTGRFEAMEMAELTGPPEVETYTPPEYNDFRARR